MSSWQYEMRANDDRGGEGLVVGNIGKEAPEIEVLPVGQPFPAKQESRSAKRESRPAEPAPVPESEPVPA